ELEAALLRLVRVGIKRDIGDAEGPSGKERAFLKPPVHHPQRLVATLQRYRQPSRRGFLRPLGIGQQSLAYGYVWLMAVLFEEQPLVTDRPFEPVGRQEARSLGKIKQDGIGLCQPPSVIELKQGHHGVGVFGRVLGRARRPRARAHFDNGERYAELRQQESRLVAIATVGHAVENCHAQLRSGMTITCRTTAIQSVLL